MALPKRWAPLRPHKIQQDYMNSKARFNVLPCGRRSGKSELAKRKLVIRAWEAMSALKNNKWKFHNANFFAAAPTRDQAKRIYWSDLKALTDPKNYAEKPKESELIITLKNNVTIQVLGMDKPERIEGVPWDGGILDEYANMKEIAWKANVRPALADRGGWCDMIGVPEGRNHYYERFKEASLDESGEWAVFHWKSSDILPPEEIASAKRMLDTLTYQQEYEGSFVSFTGRAYYNFDEYTHARKSLRYNPYEALVFCFDFNVSPGVAVIAQEQILPGCFEFVPNAKRFKGSKAMEQAIKSGKPGDLLRIPITGTGVIGEVYIPQNSNTPAVCNRLIQDWGDHKGPVLCYGDATGGAKGTAKTEGSDWELIDQMLSSHFRDVDIILPRQNPPERFRVNSVNTRLKTADGTVRMLIDPNLAPHLVTDFEGVRTLEGGTGEIDKKRDKKLSHLTDSLGYYICEEYPIHTDNELRELKIYNRF